MKKGWIMFLIIGTLLFTGNINLVSATIGEEEKSNPYTLKYFNKEITDLINKDSELKEIESKLTEIKEMISVLVQMRTGIAERELKGELKGLFVIAGGSIQGRLEERELPERLWGNISFYYNEPSEREMIKRDIIEPLREALKTYPFSDSEIKVKTQKVVSLLEEKNNQGKITTLDLITLDDCIDEMEKEIERARKEIESLLREWEERYKKIGAYAFLIFFAGIFLLGSIGAFSNKKDDADIVFGILYLIVGGFFLSLFLLAIA